MLKMFIFKRVITPIQRRQTTLNGQLQIVAVLHGHVLETSTDRYGKRSKIRTLVACQKGLDKLRRHRSACF